MSNRDALALDADNILPEGAVRSTRASVNQPQSSTILTANGSRARMSHNWGQLSPVRNGAPPPPAPPTQEATAAAATGANRRGWTRYGPGMLILSEDDKAQIEVELSQIRISIDKYSDGHDQSPDWRNTVDEAVRELQVRLNQLKDRMASALEKPTVVRIITMLTDLETARNRWTERANQDTRDDAQPDQAQDNAERHQDPNVPPSTEENVAQGENGETVPPPGEEVEPSHRPDVNVLVEEDVSIDVLVQNIPTLFPNGEPGPFNAAFAGFMTELITVMARRTEGPDRSRQRWTNLEERVRNIQEVSDRLDHAIRHELPSRMAQLEGGLAQSDTNFIGELDALRAQMTTNAADVATLQGETRQMAATVHAHANALTVHANEIAGFNHYFRNLNNTVTNHEDRIHQLEQVMETAEQSA